MTPLTNPVAELCLAVQQAERRTAHWYDELTVAEVTSHAFDAGRADDHRCTLIGDMADTLDRLLPELGTRWMAAMYPELDLRLRLDMNLTAADLLPPYAADAAGTPGAAQDAPR